MIAKSCSWCQDGTKVAFEHPVACETKGRKNFCQCLHTVHLLRAWLDSQPIPLVVAFVRDEFPENICIALLGDVVAPGTLGCTSSLAPSKALCGDPGGHQRPLAEVLHASGPQGPERPAWHNCQHSLVLPAFSLATGRKRKHYCRRLIASLCQNTLQRHFSLKCILAKKNPYY